MKEANINNAKKNIQKHFMIDRSTNTDLIANVDIFFYKLDQTL